MRNLHTALAKAQSKKSGLNVINLIGEDLQKKLRMKKKEPKKRNLMGSLLQNQKPLITKSKEPQELQSFNI